MTSCNTVDCLFADAFAFIEQGICYALIYFGKGLEIVDQACKMPGAQNSDLYKNMMQTRDKVEERIEEIKNQPSSSDSKNLKQIRKTLEATSHAGDADLIYWLPHGVQLVIIETDFIENPNKYLSQYSDNEEDLEDIEVLFKNGTTEAPSTPSSLAILRLEKPHDLKTKSGEKVDEELLAGALIQVGPWAYPLIKERTTIMKNAMGIYVVPNPTTDHPNMFVGIILPRDLESRLEKEFVDVLKQHAIVRDSEIVENMSSEEKQRTSTRISDFLIQSGQLLAQNVHNAAKYTGEFVAEHGERYRSSIPKTETPVNINPVIRHGFFVLHKGSKGVARVTKFMLDKIGDVGVAVGRQVANSVSSGTEGVPGAGHFIKSTATVIGGGLTGVSTVWIALEDASKTLFRNFADETVQTVDVKYGTHASETAHHALYAAGHTTLAGMQLADFGPRSLAGRMARKAGVQIVLGTTDNGTAITTTVPADPKNANMTKSEQKNAGNVELAKKKLN